MVDEFINLLDGFGYGLCEEDVNCTSVTVEEFTINWGEPKHKEGDICLWKSLQVSKGKRRGDLFVMDVEGGSVSYFDGEI